MFKNWVLVTHAYNPTYWRGRDQEDQFEVKLSQIIHETLFQKYTTQLRKGLAE
jgi:hypothetical protein